MQFTFIICRCEPVFHRPGSSWLHHFIDGLKDSSIESDVKSTIPTILNSHPLLGPLLLTSASSRWCVALYNKTVKLYRATARWDSKGFAASFSKQNKSWRCMEWDPVGSAVALHRWLAYTNNDIDVVILIHSTHHLGMLSAATLS